MFFLDVLATKLYSPTVLDCKPLNPQSQERVKFPDGLQHLAFGRAFNQCPGVRRGSQKSGPC